MSLNVKLIKSCYQMNKPGVSQWVSHWVSHWFRIGFALVSHWRKLIQIQADQTADGSDAVGCQISYHGWLTGPVVGLHQLAAACQPAKLCRGAPTAVRMCPCVLPSWLATQLAAR